MDNFLFAAESTESSVVKQVGFGGLPDYPGEEPTSKEAREWGRVWLDHLRRQGIDPVLKGSLPLDWIKYY